MVRLRRHRAGVSRSVFVYSSLVALAKANDLTKGCLFTDKVFTDYLAEVGGSTNSARLYHCYEEYHAQDAYLQVDPILEKEHLRNGDQVDTYYKNKLSREHRDDMGGVLKRLCTIECIGNNVMHKRGKPTHRKPFIQCKCRPFRLDRNGEEKHDCFWKVPRRLQTRNKFECGGGDLITDDSDRSLMDEPTNFDDHHENVAAHGDPPGQVDPENDVNVIVMEEDVQPEVTAAVTDAPTTTEDSETIPPYVFDVDGSGDESGDYADHGLDYPNESVDFVEDSEHVGRSDSEYVDSEAGRAVWNPFMGDDAEPTPMSTPYVVVPTTTPVKERQPLSSASKKTGMEIVMLPRGQTCKDFDAGAENPIRVGSFNLGMYFGKKKVNDPTVMTVINQIITRKYDLVAIQGIRDRTRKASKVLLEWINAAAIETNRLYDQAVSERVGEGNTREQFSFIYDTSKLQILDIYQITDDDEPSGSVIAKDPFIAHFKRIDAHASKAAVSEFTFLTFHSRIRNNDDEADNVPAALELVQKERNYPVDTIIAADLSIDDDLINEYGVRTGYCGGFTLGDLTKLKMRQNPSYEWLIGDSVDTLTEEPKDCKGPIEKCKHNCAFDRLITTTSRMTNATCNTQIIDFSNMLPPRRKITDVSHHFPLLMELY